MKILQELKEEASRKLEMIQKKQKKIEPQYSEEIKQALIFQVENEGNNIAKVIIAIIRIQQSGRQLGISYHHAQVIINENRRKLKGQKSESNQESQSGSLKTQVEQKRASYSKVKDKQDRKFIIYNSINNKIISQYEGDQEIGQFMIMKDKKGKLVVKPIPS